MARRQDDEGRGEASNGAWAAAAVVLALGGLGFGLVARLNASDLEDRVDRLEAQVREGAAGNDVTPTTVEWSATPTTVGLEPDSPEEARAGVLHAFDVAYDGAKPIEERLSFVEDPIGVGDAIAATANGPYAAQAARSRVRVDDVNFTSGVQASVRYVVVSGGEAQLDRRVGIARSVAGTWKVTRETICADLDAAGASCDA